MPFDEDVKKKIFEYCKRDLPSYELDAVKLAFIKNSELRAIVVREFNSIRFAYKLFEGLEADQDKLIFEIKLQLIGYASIYEAILTYVLEIYFSSDSDIDGFIKHQNQNGHNQNPLSWMSFRKKVEIAKRLLLIKNFASNDTQEIIDFGKELCDIYDSRNSVHILAEYNNGQKYYLDLSKKAYWRMKPFVEQVTQRLEELRLI